ncbi:MAG: adenylate/guanylate cyclase domain-containing protein [Deltaproteobacteria bacterium]
MSTQRVKRKLAAVVHADVKGYSALMGRDEAGTVRLLGAYRDVLRGLIALHGGRLVDTAGDGFLCEFPSAVNAVEFAVEFQQEIGVKNADLPEGQRMEFRIGINVGDVIEEDGGIYGDGVNIAARLEGLAEAGGICISGTVYDQIKNKMDLGFHSLGEQTVKNIVHPIRAFKIRTGPDSGEEAQDTTPSKKTGESHAALYLIIGLGLLVLAVGIGVWLKYSAPGPKVLEPVAPPSSQGTGLSEAEVGAGVRGGNGSGTIRRAAELMLRDTKEANLEARRLLEKEIQLHPRSARAFRMLGLTYVKEARRGWGQDPRECMRKARQFRNKAMRLMRMHGRDAVTNGK